MLSVCERKLYPSLSFPHFGSFHSIKRELRNYSHVSFCLWWLEFHIYKCWEWLEVLHECCSLAQLMASLFCMVVVFPDSLVCTHEWSFVLGGWPPQNPPAVAPPAQPPAPVQSGRWYKTWLNLNTYWLSHLMLSFWSVHMVLIIRYYC